MGREEFYILSQITDIWLYLENTIIRSIACMYVLFVQPFFAVSTTRYQTQNTPVFLVLMTCAKKKHR